MSDTNDTDGPVDPTEPPEPASPVSADAGDQSFASVDPPEQQEERTLEAVIDHPEVHKRIVRWTLGAYGASSLVALAASGVLGLAHTDPLYAFWLAAPAMLHAALSIKRSRKENITWRYSYDIALGRAPAGLRFVPFGLEDLEAEPRDAQKVNVPAHEDKIFWGDEKEPLPPGLTRPIFMFTTVNVADAKGKVIRQAQMSVGVGWFILWGINNVPNFRSNSRSIEEVNGQLRMISHAVIGEDIAHNDLDTLLASLAKINRHLDDHLRLRTKNWGIDIYEVGIFKINPSHDFAKAQRDAAMAPYEAQAKITGARATATERVLLGEADGKAAAARTSGPLLGRAKGYDAIKTVGVSDTILASETARDVAANTEVLMTGAEGGLRDLLGMVVGGQRALERTRGRGGRNQPAKTQQRQSAAPQS